MHALTLPPPLPSSADQSDYLSAIAGLEELATVLGARARETGVELAGRLERTDDVLADESALRQFCSDALQRIEGAATGRREGEDQTAHRSPVERVPAPSGPPALETPPAGSLTQRAVAAKQEQDRQAALRQLRMVQGPRGALLAVENVTEAARRRLAGENVVHRSAAPRTEMTITERCREALRLKQ